jgi:adenine phosphoribosyltransferase
VEYSLEYGQSQLDIHADALEAGSRVVIVDDVLATGGTARAAAKLVELVGGEVAGVLFVIELEQLGGRRILDGYAARSLIQYS